MSIFDRFNKEKLKNAALAAKEKIESGASELSSTTLNIVTSSSDIVRNFDYEAAHQIAKDKALAVGRGVANSTTETLDKVRDFDYEGAAQSIKGTAADVSGSVTDAVSSSINTIKSIEVEDVRNYASIKFEQINDDMLAFKDKAVECIINIDFDEVKDSAVQFSNNSISKLNKFFKTTFELDKTTFDMVQDVRSRLPTPAASMDDIYEQCRKEAIRRAIVAFMLGNIIDDKSQARYEKLSDNYDSYRIEHKSTFGNYARPSDLARASSESGLINDYNRDGALLYADGTASVDHITSRKEIFSSILLKAGLTNEELGEIVNDPANLGVMVRGLNSQKSDMDMYEWLGQFSRPHPEDPNKLIVTIKSTKEEHIVDKNDVEEMYNKSKEHLFDAKVQAVKELTSAVALTSATMAAQQVVGLIIVETIDVFMDELKLVKLVSSDGLIEELKNSKNRLTYNLGKRFEERQIWSRAKSLGIEAGVAGALSVIPQILISLVLKMPAFVYAIIRESTLSVVRAIRILSSNEEDKFAALQVILFGAASAVAGIYVQQVISHGVSTVPLLNQFNAQISGILTGMLITAIPLAAIYTFEQNKAKLVLRMK